MAVAQSVQFACELKAICNTVNCRLRVDSSGSPWRAQLRGLPPTAGGRAYVTAPQITLAVSSHCWLRLSRVYL
jgi:hypothetical protein